MTESQENESVWGYRFENQLPSGKYIKLHACTTLPRQKDLFHMTCLQLFEVESDVI